MFIKSTYDRIYPNMFGFLRFPGWAFRNLKKLSENLNVKTKSKLVWKPSTEVYALTVEYIIRPHNYRKCTIVIIFF